MEPATLPSTAPLQTEKTIHRFTVDDYYTMAKVGILSATERVELIDGQILARSPIGSRHAACVKRINHAFAQALGLQAIVSVQDPVRLDRHTEPEPDIALLRYREDFYRTSHPTAKDILLIVEVADSSAAVDRSIKKHLYAKHGVPEFWIVALEEACLEIYREPTATGYNRQQRLAAGDTLHLQAFPDLRFAVADLMP